MNPKPLAELAELLGARLVGNPDILISGVAGVREARPGDITFLANPRYEVHLAETRASAVLLAEPRAGNRISQLITADPYLAFLKAVRIFRQERPRPLPGIHPTAAIAGDAVLGREVSVGPYAVLEEGALIGDGAVIMAHAYVGHRARIGAGSFLYPHVIVREECELGDRVVVHAGTVIGADGFGYAKDGDAYQKIPQVGNVIIGDDVELGANVCVDRATTGATRIGRGAKIDNLVMIGHNVEVGEDVIIVAQTGISGSTRVGAGVVLAGQVGVVGHIEIGAGAVVASRSGVTKSVPPGITVSGFPARPHGVERRIQASLARLPHLTQRLQRLEERIKALESAPDHVTH